MNLQEMMVSSFEKIKASGFIEKKVEDRIQKTIEEIINDTFREYSDFGKNLKELVSNAVNVNLKELNLPEYNQLILNVIKIKMSHVIQEQGFTALQKDIEELLAGEQREWKLSELVEKLKEDAADDAVSDNWEEISLHVEDGYSLVFIYMDKEPNKEKYECDVRIVVSNGNITAAESRSRKFDEQFWLGKLYGIEKLLFRLYAQKVKFIVDKNDVNVCYEREDYED